MAIKKSSNLIKKLRLDKNLTQQELATILNISKSSITSYECGKRQPSARIIAKLENFFNVSADYILGNTNLNNQYIYNSRENNEDENNELSNLLKKISSDKVFITIMKNYEKIDENGKNKLLERSEELHKLYPIKH